MNVDLLRPRQEKSLHLRFGLSAAGRAIVREDFWPFQQYVFSNKRGLDIPINCVCLFQGGC